MHEIKWDGYRLICFIKNDKVQFFSRNQHDWTHYFPRNKQALERLKLGNAILDGEMVVLDKKQHANFQLLQNTMHNRTNNETIYYVFDLLYFAQQDLRKLTLLERKKLLKKIIPWKKQQAICFSDYVIGNGPALFKKACQLQLEGIVAKECASPYVEKRTRTWLKIKCNQRQEFIICGFTKPHGTRAFFGALVLGYYDKQQKLRYCGCVGTGFTEATLKQIKQTLKKYISKQSPFQNPPKITEVTWTKPKMIAEVEFLEWTEEGALRHPSFKGIRSDKSAKNIHKETPKRST